MQNDVPKWEEECGGKGERSTLISQKLGGST